MMHGASQRQRAFADLLAQNSTIVSEALVRCKRQILNALDTFNDTPSYCAKRDPDESAGRAAERRSWILYTR